MIEISGDTVGKGPGNDIFHGMNHQMGRFIDDQQVLVFVNDIEGHGFGGKGLVFETGIKNRNGISGFNGSLGMGWAVIYIS